MKQTLIPLYALLALMLLASCTSKKHGQTEEDAGQKCLILYYSQTGMTKVVAEEIQKALGADLERIEVEPPYDGDYQQTIDRCRHEIENDIVPMLKPLKSRLDDYDVVFLGYPIWFSSYARPIIALTDSLDFAGKKVVPFYTFGNGRPETSVSDLKKALPQARISESYCVHNARLDAVHYEIDRFLKLGGFIKGGVEPVDDYSSPTPVNEEERAILETACHGYQFPIGTPMTVGIRKTSNGTDYKYNVESIAPDGEELSYTIYVTIDNTPNAKPEFTKVVR